MGVILSITVLRDGAPVNELQFDSDAGRTLKIGRLATAQVRLDDPRVSRIHAIVDFGGPEAALTDMGSTEGTLLNGARVSKAKLAVGDVITVGATSLRVEGLVAAAGAPVGASAGPVAAGGAGADGGAGRVPAAGIQGTAGPGRISAGGAGPTAGSGRISADVAGATAASALAAQRFEGAAVEAAGAAGGSGRVSEGGAGATAVAAQVQQRLRGAAVGASTAVAETGGAQQDGAAVEAPLTHDNRVLELRYYWGEVLLGMHHYVRPRRVTIGENVTTDIFISSEGLPREAFPLLRYQDDAYLFAFTSQMDGEIEHDGEVRTLAAARGSWARADDDLADTFVMPMGANTRALCHWGGASFAMRFVPPAQLVPAPFGKHIDLAYVQAIALSLLLHVVAVTTLALTPRDADALKVDLFGEPDRFASLILEAPKKDEAADKLLEKIKRQVEAKQEQIEAPSDKPKPKKAAELTEVTPHNVPKPHKSAEEKRAEVAKRFDKLLGGGGSNAGGLLGGGGGGSLSGTLQNVIGTAGAGSASAGLAGLGVRGSGPLTGGGIGTSRGLAGIGTSGRLGGGGTAYGSGVGLGAAKQRDVVDLETPQIEGALSADVIKKVINENRNQVRYCYEVELQRNQGLEGRVVVHWVIDGNGAVASVNIKESTLKNAAVEACLMAKIKAWKFPSPAGGGTVEVNYPFVFKAS